MVMRSGGFSLIELVVTLGIVSLVTFGSGRALIGTVLTGKENQVHSEVSGITNELRSWMVQNRRAPLSCSTNTTLPGYPGKDDFVTQSATVAGTPIQVVLGPNDTVADGQTLNTSAGAVFVESLRFNQAQAIYADAALGVTYYSGQLTISSSTVQPGSHTSARKVYSPRLVGGLTIAVNDASGAVVSCTALEQVSAQTACLSIKDNANEGADCVQTAPSGIPTCPPGTVLKGYIPSTLQALCVNADLGCGTTASGLRVALSGIGYTGSVAYASCTNLPPTPTTPYAENPTLFTVPTTLTGLGSNGSTDCSDPALISSYQACVDAKTLQGENISACGPAPTACYTTQVSTGSGAGTSTSTSYAPLAAGACACGASSVSNGGFCGAYIPLDYGLSKYTNSTTTPAVAMSVYACTNGNLNIIYGATMADPTMPYWGSYVPVVLFGGQYVRQ